MNPAYVIIPLVLGSVMYVAQAGLYQLVVNRPGMALCFLGYALANIGLIWDALTVGKL